MTTPGGRGSPLGSVGIGVGRIGTFKFVCDLFILLMILLFELFTLAIDFLDTEFILRSLIFID